MAVKELIRTVGVAARADVSEVAHPAMQATIRAAALAANNLVWLI